MNPEAKLLADDLFCSFTDEMGKRFDELDSRLDKRFADRDAEWERQLADVHDDYNSHITTLEKVAGSLEEWRPEIEGTMDDVRLVVKKLNIHAERAALENHSASPGVLAPSPSAAGRPPAGNMADRPHGHRVEPICREDGYGSVTTVMHPPVKGTSDPQPPTSTRFHGAAYDSSMARVRSGEHSGSAVGKLPKLPFPEFHGDNPRLWLSRVEIYFEMYYAEPSAWVKLASMCCYGPAGRWVQSVDKRLKSVLWPEFCVMVLERFGRNEHESPLRQLFHIKQTTSVVDYVDRFTQLVDQLVAYDTPGDSLFFTTRFIDGLRDDVRAVVAVQRPSNLDTACSLALLQDEVADSTRRRDFRKPDFSSLPKQYPKGPLPLPVPPDKPAAAPDDSRAVSSGKSVEEKMASLRAYRRARGLCELCAEKWVRGHRCSTSIQLHAMQEVWDLFDTPDVGFPNDASVDTPSDSHLLLTISKDAVSGSAGPKTMQFAGVIQGIPVLILVDSGSTNFFLSDRVVQQLSDISLVPVDLSVKVANGGLMQCTSVMPACSWEMQGHKFAHDLRVLDLHSYDHIIGMDWLELYSPMKIHWGHRWMAIPYQGHTILL